MKTWATKWNEEAPWQMLSDGDDGIWLYWRKQGMCYWFIGVTDLREHLAEKEWRDAGAKVNPYEAVLKLVDLSEAPPEKVVEARHSCGCEGLEVLDDETELLRSAEALASYGTYARMGIYRGTHMDRARALAREECDRLMNDDEHYDAQLGTTANGIGQTRREAMRGDLWSALQRVKDNPTAATIDQSITLKMYQKCERTLGGEKIPDSLRDGPVKPLTAEESWEMLKP